jgi:hypothetical protein
MDRRILEATPTEGIETSVVSSTELDGKDRLFKGVSQVINRKKRGQPTGLMSFLVIIFSTGVATGLGFTVLIY